MKKTALSLSLVLIFFFGSHQVRAQEYSFLPYEQMKLEAYYNLGPFWVHAGNVELTADTVTYEGQKCARLTAVGYSLKKWNFIFSLEDHYSSIVRLNGFLPLTYEKKTMENGFWIHNVYHFDWHKDSLNVFTQSIRDAAKDTTYSLQNKLYDVLTACYYLRTLNTKNYHPYDTIPIPIITDGKFYSFKIIYLGKKSLKRKKDRVECDVFTIDNMTSTFFSGKEPLKVYVSDDPRKFIIYVEANIVVGSLKVYQEGYIKMRPVKSSMQ
ncbi:MAG: DUF3108 domain-containing protein [Bacteroidales bacterium]|nr:DUF3108 domain-containing protein [Bacteroidales bacterium]